MNRDMAKLPQMLSVEPTAKDRLQGVDAFRLLAALAVVLQHTRPFDGVYSAMIRGKTQHYLAGILEITIKQGARFAVPFFFTISGYFLCNKVMNGQPPIASLLLYSKRIVTVWGAWSILYFFIPHDASVLEQGYFYFISSKVHYYGTHLSDLLKNGAVGHFYFFPNLLVGIYLTTLLYLLRVRYLIIIPALWYCLYLFSLMYPPQSEGIFSNILQSYAFQMFAEGTLFVAIGWWLRSTSIRIQTGPAIAISLAGFLYLLVFEVLEMPALAHIGIVPYTVGLVMLSLSLSSGGTECYLARLGRYSLGIYTSHMLYVFLIANSGYGMRLYYILGYYGYMIAHSTFVFSLSLILSIALSKPKRFRPLVV